MTALVDGDKPSTKAARAAIEKLSSNKHQLVVVTNDDQVTELSVRNLPNVHTLHWGQLNTYDVLMADDIIFTEAALNAYLGKNEEAAK